LESNAISYGCQPQYPDLQGHFSIDSEGVQGVFGTTRHLPALTRHAHAAYSVIEEFVKGFVESFLIDFRPKRVMPPLFKSLSTL
jgi:hypothetical protein